MLISRVAALTVSLVTAVAASAQETDTELLRAILCELRELRAAVQQGQVVTPLIDANTRERIQIREQLSALEEQQIVLDQAMQSATARQSQLREALRNLPPSSPNPGQKATEQLKDQLESGLQTTAETLQQHQAKQSRLSADIAHAESRLAELEGEFDQMQAQMRNLASMSATVCETVAQD